jgi:Ca2+-binding RTX toxin-like protein
MATAISADSNSGTTLNLNNEVYLIRATYTTNNSTAFTITGSNSPVVFQDGGSVFNIGTGTALLVQSASQSVTVNAGSSLVSGGNAILVQASGQLHLINHGLVKSTGTSTAIANAGNGSTIDNYGEISSLNGFAYSAAGSSGSTINNHGTFRAADINAALDLADGSDVVNNHTTIFGETRLHGGTDSIFNSGTMLGSVAIEGFSGDGNKKITNIGFIGTTSLGDDAIELLGGNDVVTNFGTISGSVHLGGGFDGYHAYDGATISANVFGEAGDDSLTGNDFDDSFNGGDDVDTLTGNGGNDVLAGGAGSDTMSGGTGNDTFLVDDLGDVIYESEGQGSDSINAAASYTLAAGIEVERMTNSAGGGLTLTGNEFVQTIYGHFTAADTLAGGGAADTMFGLGGNDTYVVDNAGDIVDESFFGSGTDTVQSSVTFSLVGALQAKGSVENLILTGAAAINGTGDGLANVISGNSGNNVLDGGGGADALIGFAGNDTYMLGNGSDAVTDTAGTDTITSTITRSLAPFATVENLTLLGAGAINGTGNGLANIITGSASANILDGGTDAAVDSLRGLAGNDTYVLGNGNDAVQDTAGIDTVTSTITRSLASFVAIENLTLLGAGNGTGNGLANIITGSAAANTLDGGLNNDTLVGLAGSDILIGNLGKDTMTGGLNNDIFRFAAKTHSVVGADADVITDFDDSGNDTIDLSALFGPAMTYRHNLAFTAAGQVRIDDIAGADVIIEVNTVGSLAADFAVRLANTTLASMSATDFFL